MFKPDKLTTNKGGIAAGLGINMKLSNERKIRPKFLAILLLVLGFILLIGGWYTVGMWGPMIIVSVILFAATSNNAIAIYPIQVFHIVFVLVCIIGTVTLILFGLELSISWYITAAVFSVSFKVVRILLGVIGLSGLFTSV